MLDVHHANHPDHSWRDFFVHIATICIGLLIAIGLEQSVEWIHHRHQLHQLEEDLHTEGLRNLHIALDNIRSSEQRRQIDVAQYVELVNAARAHRPPATLPWPQEQNYIKPAYAVWTVAQQSDTSGLLPREDAQRYVRLYSVVQIAADQVDAINAVAAKKSVTLLPSVSDPSTLKDFPGNGQPFHYDLSLLPPDDLRQVRDAVGNDIATARLGISRNVYLYGIQWAVLHGSRSDEENLRILYDAMAVYHRGGTDALLTKYPLPDSTTSIASQSPENSQ